MEKGGCSDLFIAARRDDPVSIADILTSGTDPNDRDGMGRTALHICSTYGCCESAVVLLKWNADHTLQDYENGWTPLHRSLYFGHIKMTLLLLKAGAQIGDEVVSDNWDVDIYSKCEVDRHISQCSSWKSPIDHDGLSPLDLLSLQLSPTLVNIFQTSCSPEVLAFGRADFFLGIPLPRAAVDVSRPRHLTHLIDEPVRDIATGKYHSAALTSEGKVFTWGIGRGGRLGHGDEASQPHPELVNSFPEGVKITAIAAGENHMLAVDSRGNLFSWGSNRFGQLGRPTKSSSSGWCPQRVDKFRRHSVCGIAAGENHSVCFTSAGVIYTWGCNKHGQLGVRLTGTESGCGAPGSSSPVRVALRQANVGTSSRSGWDDGESEEEQVVLQVCASRCSTLVLARLRYNTSTRGKVNDVFQWGHGSYNPTRVQFLKPTPDISTHIGVGCKWSGASDHRANVTRVSAGYHHFVAMDGSSGCVFTWGLGAVQLGHGRKEQSHLSSPQLLRSLLPENGGGKVVDVSAAGDRTCVVTSSGDVYTWGFSAETGVLGHGEGKYQPVPKRIVGIKRAVKVSASVDHTLVLTVASVPPLPHSNSAFQAQTAGSSATEDVVCENDSIVDSSNRATHSPLRLKQLCEQTIARSVNRRNVIDVLSVAEHFDAQQLALFCVNFILRNLDAILAQHVRSSSTLKVSVWSDLDLLIADIEDAVGRLGITCPSPETMQTPRRDSCSGSETISYAPCVHPLEYTTPNKEDKKDLDPTDVPSARRMLRSVKKKLTIIENSIASSATMSRFELDRYTALQKRAESLLEYIELHSNEDKESSEMTNLPGSGSSHTPIVSETTGKDLDFLDTRKGVDATSSGDITQRSREKKRKKKFIPVDVFIAGGNSIDGREGFIPTASKGEVLSESVERSVPSGGSRGGVCWSAGTHSKPPSYEQYLSETQSSTSNPSNATGTERAPGNAWKTSTPRKSKSVNILNEESVSPTTPVNITGQIGVRTPPVRPKMNGGGPNSSGRAAGITLDAFISVKKQTKKTEKHNDRPRSVSSPWMTCSVTQTNDTSFTENNKGNVPGLREIQLEEEITRQESKIKQLKGNSIPWLVDRRSARAYSFERVVQKQKEEKEQQIASEKEQLEIDAAIAAVERLKEEEKKKSRRRKKQGCKAK